MSKVTFVVLNLSDSQFLYSAIGLCREPGRNLRSEAKVFLRV